MKNIIKSIISIIIILLIISSTLVVGTNNSFDVSNIKTNDNININQNLYLETQLGEVTKKIWDESTSTWVDSIQAEIDDILTFNITIKYIPLLNHSYFVINISVNDTLPPCLEYVTDSGMVIYGYEEISGQSGISTSKNKIFWNLSEGIYQPYSIVLYNNSMIGMQNMNDSVTILFNATVIDYTDTNGEENHVEVVGWEKCPSRHVYGEDDATIIVSQGEPQVTVEKYVKWACEGEFQKQITADINDWLTFILYVNNTGDVPLDISVRDELPSGLSYIIDSSTVDGITVGDEEPEISGNFLYWNFTDVPADTHIVITFRAEVDECDELINIGNVTGEDDSQNIVYDEDNATVNVECPTPELVIDKKVWNETSNQWEENITANIGETVRFNITISYYGPNILYDIYINDTLPNGLEYANNAIPPESWVSGNNIYWNLTDDYDVHLNGGESFYIEFDATVLSTGEHINVVNITANECSGIIMHAEDNAIVYVKTITGLIICEKYVKDKDGSWVEEISANIGDTVRFNITITYIGSIFTYSIWVNDTLPDCLEFDNNAKPKAPTINGNKLLWHFQDDYLDPGESIYIEYDAIVIDEGVGVNIVNIRACECNECEELLCSDSATVNCYAELFAEASANPTEIQEGETVTFTGDAAGGIQPYTWSWDFDDSSADSSMQSPSHQFNNAGNYLVTLTVTDDNDNIDTDNIQIIVNEIEENTKPNKPSKPSGTTDGKAETEYTYSTSATDPESDQLLYLWDWGDGTNSGWLGPYNSGSLVTESHSWADQNTYEIKVRVKDPDGLMSDWSDPLSVTMPYNKLIPNFIINILNMLKEKFPFMEKIIINIFY